MDDFPEFTARNYALTESEANTCRAALKVVEETLLGKKKMYEEPFEDEIANDDSFQINDPAYLMIVAYLEKVQAALDALK